MSEGTWDSLRQTRTAVTDPREIETDQTALPVRFAYTPRYRFTGVALAGASSGLLLAGLFLLSQVSSTPALAVQVSAVGLLLSGGGLFILYQAILRLLGTLIVHEQGITQLPTIGGFSIPWRKLSLWVVRDQLFPGAGIPVVRFWVYGDPLEFTVPADSLSENNLRTLRQILREHAPERELGFR